MKYKAILMAAGRGTRLSRKIQGSSKCTLDIGGISLVRHTVEMLLNFDIDVHIVVGYCKQQVFKALEGLPVTFHENVFYYLTNSVASLWFAKDELCGDAIILGNADVYWEEDILDVLLKEKRNCVMLCDSSKVEEGDYLFRVEDEKILEYGKGNRFKANCEYVGLAMLRGDMITKCKSQLIDLLETRCHNDWWEFALYRMISKHPVWAKDIAGHFWEEIDFVEDYERILSHRKCRGV